MKLNKHAWALWGITLAVVIALMVLIPFTRTAAWWIGAACTILMFGVCAYAFHAAFRKGETLESKLLGWPIFKVGYVALLIQIAVGAIIMSLAHICPVRVAAIVEILVYAAAGVSLTIKDASRNVVTSVENTVEDKTANWKSIRAKVNALAAANDNPAIKKLAEEIRFADPMPTGMDGEIAAALEEMTQGVTEENVSKVMRMVRERKELGKSIKQQQH